MYGVGFASYVEKLAVSAIKPESRSREEAIDQLQHSITADVANNSHPLQNDFPPYAEVGHVGGITYDKGASINRMTEKFLTEETFQKGLRYYLKDM
jgi:aminopeptidase N